MPQYDVIIIGTGPGGYGAAVTAGKKGAKVCLIEKDKLGGVCVNKGCISTKTILKSALIYEKLKQREQYGIEARYLSVNYSKVLARAENVVSAIRKNIEQAIHSGKIDLIHGEAELLSEGKVRVNDKELTSKRVIIASGSEPKGLRNFPFDNNRILSSEAFLELRELPQSVLIVGAGVIGCEWAGILASMDVSVTLIEARDKILPEEDPDLTRVVEANLKKMGVLIKLNARLENISQDKAIICVGRDAVTKGFDILEKKEGGWIKVDNAMRTNIPGISAVGDVKGPPLLAYTAEREGIIAASNALGEERLMDYSIVPRVVFSMPELASVGITENETENACTARAFFKGLGRALADGETDGFVKIIYDKSSYKILGVGIAGSNAGELINEAVIAIKCGLTLREWASAIKPHPVLSEIFNIAIERVKIE